MMLRITRRGRENLAMQRGRALAAELLLANPIKTILADPKSQEWLTANGVSIVGASDGPMRPEEIEAFLGRVDDETLRENLNLVYEAIPEAREVLVGGRLGDFIQAIQKWMADHPTAVAIAKLLITLALMMLAPAQSRALNIIVAPIIIDE